MYQKGDLDPALAMQLLGTAVQPPENQEGGTKRPLDSQDGQHDSQEEAAAALDEVLHQAKKAKMDPLKKKSIRVPTSWSPKT